MKFACWSTPCAFFFFEFHPTFAQARAYNDYQRHWFDEKVQTARHLDELKRFGDILRAKNYPVKIKLGLEICFFPQHADVIEQVTRDGYFDLLLGSVHWIDNWTFNQRKNQWQGRDVNALYRRYFELQIRQQTAVCLIFWPTRT